MSVGKQATGNPGCRTGTSPALPGVAVSESRWIWVIEVGEVAEAEDVLGAGTPVDLVFCDVHFACGRNDLDALRRLTDHDPRFPVVVTSSCNVAATVRSLAIEFIPKPYSLLNSRFVPAYCLETIARQSQPPGEIAAGPNPLQPVFSEYLTRMAHVKSTPCPSLPRNSV